MRTETFNITPKRDWHIFLHKAACFLCWDFPLFFPSSEFFFQTLFAHQLRRGVETWLGYIGGVVIILFGLFLLNLFTPKNFSNTITRFQLKKRFGSYLLTSFVFGAAFAVGWTHRAFPRLLAAILALAAVQSTSAFLPCSSPIYALGIGSPFLLVGLFTNQSSSAYQQSWQMASLSAVYFWSVSRDHGSSYIYWRA